LLTGLKSSYFAFAENWNCVSFRRQVKDADSSSEADSCPADQEII